MAPVFFDCVMLTEELLPKSSISLVRGQQQDDPVKFDCPKDGELFIK